MYRAAGAMLVRAPAYPHGFQVPAPPLVSGRAVVDVPAWRDWITEVCAQPSIIEAIDLASPILAHRVAEIASGRVQAAKQIRRAGLSLVRYLLRFQYRSTPFGLFAGVAPAVAGPQLALHWGDSHQPIADVDAVWLSEVITRLESCWPLLRRLTVRAEPCCYERGDRLVIPFLTPLTGDVLAVTDETSWRSWSRAPSTQPASPRGNSPHFKWRSRGLSSAQGRLNQRKFSVVDATDECVPLVGRKEQCRSVRLFAVTHCDSSIG